MSHQVNLLKDYQVNSKNFLTHPFYDPRYAHHYPLFGWNTIDMMLRDSRIRFGLWLIKGPIATYTKFFSEEESENPAVNQAIIDQEYHFSYKICCDDKTTEEFIIKTFNRFWEDGLLKALRAIEWGFSPNQTIYRRNQNTGMIEYCSLIPYSTKVVRPVSRDNRLVGIYLRRENKKIYIPKAFIHVHQREYDIYTGQSRLFGAHIPWHETWNMGGARDIRRLWYFKNSYDSGTLYVPEGSTVDEQTGESVSNIEIGMEIMEKTQTGSYRVLPKRTGAAKQESKDWEYEDPRSRTTPDGMREYIKDLRGEELEGLGIPPEVVESQGAQGLGSASGRKVPYMAFISSLLPVTTEVITDFRTQVVNYLLQVNGLSTEYTMERIIPKVEIPIAAGGPGQTQSTQSSLTDE